MTSRDDDTPVQDIAAADAPPKPKAPRKRRVAKVGAEVEGNTPAPHDEPPVAAPSPEAQTPSPELSAQPPVDGDGGDGDAARRERRRGRNRRRGRRGGERAAGAPELPAADGGEVFSHVLSGAFDTECEEPVDVPPDADVDEVAETAPAEPTPASTADNESADAVDGTEAPAHRRVLAPEPDAPKLQKVLAQSGIGSRRDLEQMIADGRVSVNGETAHTGQRIAVGDQIRIDDKPVRVRIAPPKARVLAYHKPVGEVVTHDDPQQRPTVFRRLPRLAQGKWQSVGRLDINTEGLLLFTNSGELANQLMHPRFGVEREYAVRSLGALDDAARERLLAGVEIDGQPASFKSIEDGGGEGVNHWYRVVITEGRNREVRRLFEAVGHAVSRLIRIRYGSVVLPHGLKRGVCVDLDDADVKLLRRLAGAGAAQPAPQKAREPREAREPDGERSGRNRRNRRRNKPDAAPGEASDRFSRGENGPIPNPLQQTFDKRAIQQARRQPRDIDIDREDHEDDFRAIPNPLVQTYDKSGLQRERRERDRPEDGPIPNPLQQTFDKRGVQKPRPFGASGKARGGRQGGGSPGQPDPMQTAVGYIGADAFNRKGSRRAGGKGPRASNGPARGQGNRGGRGR